MHRISSRLVLKSKRHNDSFFSLRPLCINSESVRKRDNKVCVTCMAQIMKCEDN